MRLSVRPVSYAVVATLAMVAIWLTPPLEKKQVFPMQPVVVTRPGVEPADFSLTPLLVEASNTELLDTLAISGVIQSSLYNALNESGVGVLPPSARHKLAWSLADIFEYKVDMSRDLRQGDGSTCPLTFRSQTARSSSIRSSAPTACVVERTRWRQLPSTAVGLIPRSTTMPVACRSARRFSARR